MPIPRPAGRARVRGPAPPPPCGYRRRPPPPGSGVFSKIERLLQLLARRSQILQQFHFVIEVDDEGHILIFAKHLVEEAIAGVALGFDKPALAHAGIHQQPERERKIALLGEVADGLRPAVLGQGEIVLGQIADDVALLVADGREDVDNFDIGGEGRIGRGRRRAGGRE